MPLSNVSASPSHDDAERVPQSAEFSEIPVGTSESAYVRTDHPDAMERAIR
jgi:hypothetical protein